MDEEKLFRFHFTYSESEGKSSCRHCRSKFIGKNISNLKRHTEKKHPERAQETDLKTRKRPSTSRPNADQEPPQKIRKLTRGELIQSCVELVTINLVPYNLFSFSPFKKIIQIHKESANISVNPQAVQNYVEDSATQMKLLLKDELKCKMIGLKLDIATRLGRSVLGVNAQFYSHDYEKIMIRSLGMLELKNRHTASNISIMLSDLLRSFDIDQRSIISITCDNGANIIATAKLFQEHQNSVLLGDQIDEMRLESQDEFDNDEEDEREFDCNGPSDIPIHIKEALTGITSIAVLVRCSIHTLQLAVHDSLKEIKQMYGIELQDIRKVLKNLSSSVYVQHVNSLGLKIPGLDVITRWNSSYSMVHKMLAVKDKVEKLYEKYENSELAAIKLYDHHWSFMDKFHKSFKPCYDLTIKLQSTQVGIGMNDLCTFLFRFYMFLFSTVAEFYFCWRKCLYQLKQDSKDNDFSNIIYEKMSQRTDSIYDKNDALLSALYIDPRYNYLGKVWNQDLKSRAEAYLLKIHKQIERFYGNDPETAEQAHLNSNLTEFDMYLDEDQLPTGSERSNEAAVLEKIMKCCIQPRVSASVDNFDIFKFLKFKFTYDRLMLDTCLAVAATPSNQSSVERSFSALRILLSDLRSNLLPKSVEDIMLCHLNSSLFLKINFDLI